VRKSGAQVFVGSGKNPPDFAPYNFAYHAAYLLWRYPQPFNLPLICHHFKLP
jgi:hypothetical protein